MHYFDYGFDFLRVLGPDAPDTAEVPGKKNVAKTGPCNACWMFWDKMVRKHDATVRLCSHLFFDECSLAFC